MLPQVNYRVPNMRFLRDKLVVRTHRPPQLCKEMVFEPPQPDRSWPWSGGPTLMQHHLPQEVEARNEMTFSHFIQFYKNLMFDAQKSVRATACPPKHLPPCVACPPPAKPGPLLCLAGHRAAGALLPIAVSTPEPCGFHPSQAAKGRIHRVGNAAGLWGRAGDGSGNGSTDGNEDRSRNGRGDGKGGGRGM